MHSHVWFAQTTIICRMPGSLVPVNLKTSAWVGSVGFFFYHQSFIVSFSRNGEYCHSFMSCFASCCDKIPDKSKLRRAGSLWCDEHLRLCVRLLVMLHPRSGITGANHRKSQVTFFFLIQSKSAAQGIVPPTFRLGLLENPLERHSESVSCVSSRWL